MASHEERIARIVLSAARPERFSPAMRDLLPELQGLTAADLGISSVEAQGLLKKIGDEFGVEIPAEAAAKFTSVQDLTDYLDART